MNEDAEVMVCQEIRDRRGGGGYFIKNEKIIKKK